MSTPTDPYGADRDVQRAAAHDRPETETERFERWAATQAQPSAPYTPEQRTWSPGDSPVLPELDPRMYGPDARPLIVNVEQPRHSTYVEPPNHVLHGLLTLATGGVWGFVWAWRVRKYRKAMRRAHG